MDNFLRKMAKFWFWLILVKLEQQQEADEECRKIKNKL